MAKKDKAAKAEPEKTEAAPKEKAKPTPPPQPPKPKYGVPELAEALGTKAASVRVRLRNAGVPKSGKLYGWDTKAAMQEVIDKLNASKSKAKAKKAEAEDDDDEEDDEDE